MNFVRRSVSPLMILLFISSFLFPGQQSSEISTGYEKSLFKTMRWRCIGPFRGGRVTAVTGVSGQPLVFYFGATGGGVWKTEDAGLTWKPISDGYFKTGSVGALAVSESNPDIIYAGMGETSIRNDISCGDGVYKSKDAGTTWTHMGLKDTRHIARIRVHPMNPDVVYAASLGHIYGPSSETGVFRSKDGGKNWKRILHINTHTGAVDLAMDAKNPLILFAAMWQMKMTPWGIFSKGDGSGLYKTTDGGETWVELKNGLPKRQKGRTGVAISPVDPDRIWALIEADDGGLFRSDDGGRTWRLVNNDSPLRVRHSYYTHIYADTLEPDTVYVLTTPFLKSVDGGITFRSIPQPLHRDNHDLWIDPKDNLRMINGNDGGANITFNGGKSWTRLDNQPTAQMYHVTTDNQVPYRVYGAQQDNTTISIPSRMTGKMVAPDMYPVAGGESGHIAVHPENPSISYGGAMWGYFTRYDHSTKEVRDISIWPEKPMGLTAAEIKYRFNWTFPILFSPHDPDILYAAANVLFRSTDEGRSWEAISPDLTTNDKSKQKHGVMSQIYCTIFAVCESPLQKGLIWTGSDDGLVHLTKNAGQEWQNVTPKTMPLWSRVSMIEASSHDSATAYLAVNRFDLDDNHPYIYKTKDLGKSWEAITKGIAEDAFVRVVREDPQRKGLLYAGTETGVYVSFDGGENWQPLQLNLPVVPVHDLVVKNDDLVAATHGRSFWILDDVTLLHQIEEDIFSSKIHLFKPRDSYRMRGLAGYRGAPIGQNPPSGVVVHYYLNGVPEEKIALEFLDHDKATIKFFSHEKHAKEEISAENGMNRFEWDMRYPDARDIKGGSSTLFFNGGIRGPIAAPGTYYVRLSVAGKQIITQSFQIKKDRRISATRQDLKEQFNFLIKIRGKLSAVHEAANQILDIHQALGVTISQMRDRNNVRIILSKALLLKEKLAEILNKLVATNIRENPAMNFTIFSDLSYDHYAPFTYYAPTLKLNARLANIQSAVAGSDAKPTRQCYENYEMLSGKLENQLVALKKVLEEDIPEFNRLLCEEGLLVIPSHKVREEK